MSYTVGGPQGLPYGGMDERQVASLATDDAAGAGRVDGAADAGCDGAGEGGGGRRRARRRSRGQSAAADGGLFHAQRREHAVLEAGKGRRARRAAADAGAAGEAEERPAGALRPGTEQRA